MSIKQLLKNISDNLEAMADKRMDRLWSLQDVADYYGYKIDKAYEIKDEPDHPKPVWIGKQPRYVPEEIKAHALSKRTPPAKL